MWRRLAAEHGSRVALREPHRPGAEDLSFQQLAELMHTAAAGLHSLGLTQDDKVALFAEASSRWVVADQAIMMAGGVPAVRGSQGPVEELDFILRHAACRGLVVQDWDALERLLPTLEQGEVLPLKYCVALWGGSPSPTLVTRWQQLQARPGAQGQAGATSPLLTWEQVVAAGRAAGSGVSAGHVGQGRQAGGHAGGAAQPFQVVQPKAEDLATLVYTSGTTGVPRGVQLSHGNLAYQLAAMPSVLEVVPGEACLSVLPPWHIYQRTCAYYIFSRGGLQVITTIRKFRDDLTAFPPDHLVCVPLVLDTLHARVMQRLRSAPLLRRQLASLLLAVSTAYVRACRVTGGLELRYACSATPWHVLLGASLLSALLRPLHLLAGHLVYSKVREALGVRRTIISGGGSLAAHLDDFFEVLGLPVLNGWGLTETSPVLACRRAVQNVRGSVGRPLPGTSLRVVDPDTLEPLPYPSQGQGQGSAEATQPGPGVMAGYLDDPAASAKAFRAGGGWLDTGDLGWVAPSGVPGSNMAGCVVLTGRAKDTIVLSSGKNVEPQPIEDAVCASPLVKHLLLLGQDKRELGALVFPDLDALEAHLQHLQQSQTGVNGAAPAPDTQVGGGQAERPLLAATPRSVLEALLLDEVTKYNASRHGYKPEQHVAHVVVVTTGQLNPDDGTLTRTFKPRRLQISTKYAEEASRLLSQLRG
ncbi:hypothetical protein QJQ45_004659 [Haematococcus lacustris]|nr:hypothetical protein QJQ45_004659 [Haematococcus lacustris]